MVLILHDSNFEVLFAAAPKKGRYQMIFEKNNGASVRKKTEKKTNTATKRADNTVYILTAE